jgi:hypothetical protein
MRIALALVLGFAAAAPARAGDTVRFGDVVVSLGGSAWRAVGDDGAALVFTCIAADCPGGSQVYAHSEAEAEQPCPGPGHRRDAEPIAGETPLGFAAYSAWSGCRARDNPILSACAVHAGKAYHLVSTLAAGCNRAPEVPVSRFVELLNRIAPTDAGE